MSSLDDRIREVLAGLPQGRRGPKPQVLSLSLLGHSDTECWPWQGRIGTNGYGIAVIPGSRSRGTSAHRLVWELLNGPVPDGWHVDHQCHNWRTCQSGPTCPHRRCVNPFHLLPMTAKNNVRRGEQAQKDECSRGHPYTPENTYINPKGRRACRTCFRAHWRRYYWKEKDARQRGTSTSTVGSSGG